MEEVFSKVFWDVATWVFHERGTQEGIMEMLRKERSRLGQIRKEKFPNTKGLMEGA